MIERVRAVLITPDGCLLAIRRDRPDRATYWVLPGGHVDPEDQNIETALSRELSEEIAGEADITSLLQVLDSGAGDERPVLLPRPDLDVGLRRAHHTAIFGSGGAAGLAGSKCLECCHLRITVKDWIDSFGYV